MLVKEKKITSNFNQKNAFGPHRNLLLREKIYFITQKKTEKIIGYFYFLADFV